MGDIIIHVVLILLSREGYIYNISFSYHYAVKYKGVNIRVKYYVSDLCFCPIPSCFTSRILPNFKPIKPCQPWRFSFLPKNLKTKGIIPIHFWPAFHIIFTHGQYMKYTEMKSNGVHSFMNTHLWYENRKHTN